jgi:hypothetical protein
MLVVKEQVRKKSSKNHPQPSTRRVHGGPQAGAGGPGVILPTSKLDSDSTLISSPLSNIGNIWKHTVAHLLDWNWNTNDISKRREMDSTTIDFNNVITLDHPLGVLIRWLRWRFLPLSAKIFLFLGTEGGRTP